MEMLPITTLVTSIPLAEIVSPIPSAALVVKLRNIGVKSVCINPRKNVMTDAIRTSTSTPLFFERAFQPSENSFIKDAAAFFFVTAMPRRTVKVAKTVRKNVQMSMRSSSLIPDTESKKPAQIGEIRYFAEPDIPIRPLAFVYCSGVRRSVTVAL